MGKRKDFVINMIFIIVGSFVLALGINMFLTPNKISSGGISSVGTILLHLFGVKMSLTNIVANALLFLIGFKFLGKDAVIKTAVGILALTLFLELTSYLPIYSEDMMLATVVGGLLVGMGLGLVVRVNASTGGTDFIALMIKRLIPHASVANIILVLDCAIIIVSGIVFRSVTITIYSLISMYICSVIADAVVTFGNKAKAVQIFSDKSEEIATHVMEEFERGVSGIHCKGMYSGDEKIMLLCIVSPKELPLLIGSVKEIDSSAFVIINDAKEVLGEGFKTHSEYDMISNKKLKKKK